MPPKTTVSKKKAQEHVTSSLAHLKFALRHEDELRSFWFHQVIADYGLRWLEEHRHDISGTITTFPGDAVTPFRNLGCTPAELKAIAQKQSQVLLHSTIVRLVTVFENFLYDCIQRRVFIDPLVMAESKISLTADEIANALGTQSARAWFAHYIADKACRGKTPVELIERVDKLLKAGISTRLAAEIEEWRKWTLVRNAIAHLGGDVTKELATNWGERFPNSGDAINLTYKDVLRLAFVARGLAKQLESRQRTLSGRDADRDLLAYELFVRLGVDDPGKLSFAVSSTLSVKLSKTQAEQLLAQFRKAPLDDGGVTISDDILRFALAK